MSNRKRGRKFGRMRDQRHALLRSLAQALVLHGKIVTTEARAKELRSFIEKIVTKSRTGTLYARRSNAKNFKDKAAQVKIISDIAPRYKDRNGGYTRIIKRVPRRTDSAKMAVIEFVS
ncbi:MAG: 50S ribosomal protein L17 [Candidatus Spechtbacterales bacterium]